MIVFLACSKSKSGIPCPACNMYTGSLFQKSLKYAQRLSDDVKIYILSAKYGLLELNQLIEPYDKTLNTMNKKERLEWADMVLKQCIEKGISFEEEAIFLCGKRYREFVMDKFKDAKAPLANLGLGRQLEFYNKEENK